jgi:hypothetical protein
MSSAPVELGLEERLAGLRRDEQRHRAESTQEAQVEVVAGRIEEFRAAVAQGLERATFAQKRALRKCQLIT